MADDKNKPQIPFVDGEPYGKSDSEVFAEYEPKWSTAYAKFDKDKYDKFELAYRGTQKTTANVNSTRNAPVKKTNVVRNIIFELIESQINTDVPEPQVISRKPGFQDQAKMIEEKIKSDLFYLNADTMSDILERTTYTNGVGIVMLHWDINKGNHNELGEKTFVNKHPKQLVPQPGVYEFEDMDYFFFAGVATKDYLYKKYGIDVDAESLRFPEMNEITSDGGNIVGDDGISATSTDELADEIICFFKDDDGEVGKIVWVGDTIVDFQPLYFYPRSKKCLACGESSAQDAEVCDYCNSKRLQLEISTYEIIETDMELSPISYRSKEKKVENDKILREPTIKVSDKENIKERIVPAGTKIRRYAPKEFPVIKRINIPLAFSFRGISDVEIILTLQESLKKVISRIEEKILLAPAIIGKPRSLNKEISNTIYEVFEGKIADIGSIVKHDLQANISQDIAYAATLYEYAKSTVGVTDSFQGKYDPSARTGRAKQVQVQQSAGRLESKYKNKHVFYSRLFRMMYFFDLVFSQEVRPFFTQDIMGRITYKEFNKYDLLCQDDAGEWYYNTDFIFKSRVSSQIPADDISIMSNSMEMVGAGLLQPEQFWMIMDDINHPLADKILEQIRTGSDQKVEMMLSALQNLQPEMLQGFFQQPINEQIEMLEEIIQGQTNEQ